MHAMMPPPVNRITMQLLTCQGEGRVSCDDVNKKEEVIHALNDIFYNTRHEGSMTCILTCIDSYMQIYTPSLGHTCNLEKCD